MSAAKKTAVIGAIAQISGFVLIGITAGWIPAIGLFIWQFGANCSNTATSMIKEKNKS